MSIETRQTTLSPIFAKTAGGVLQGLFWLGCFMLLGGCGIKGPLYLPSEKTVTPESAPAATAPAPEGATK